MWVSVWTWVVLCAECRLRTAALCVCVFQVWSNQVPTTFPSPSRSPLITLSTLSSLHNSCLCSPLTHTTRSHTRTDVPRNVYAAERFTRAQNLICNLNPHPCTHTGGPGRWKVISVACGGRHSLALALPVRQDPAEEEAAAESVDSTSTLSAVPVARIDSGPKAAKPVARG